MPPPRGIEQDSETQKIAPPPLPKEPHGIRGEEVTLPTASHPSKVPVATSLI